MYIYDHRRPIVDGGAHVVFGVYERLAVENLLAHVSPKHVGDLCCFWIVFSKCFLKVYKRLGRCHPIDARFRIFVFMYFSKHTSVKKDGGHL
jgi:hypothetical protein